MNNCCLDSLNEEKNNVNVITIKNLLNYVFRFMHLLISVQFTIISYYLFCRQLTTLDKLR